jgi:hypothetical protein
MAVRQTYTYIAPGQRFARLDRRTWHATEHLTVLQVDRDAHGLTWVTYRERDGEELTGPAALFEAAIAAGALVPVAFGRLAAQC